MKAEDRIKVKQYEHESLALHLFLADAPHTVSDHVKNAVKQRINIITRELKILKS